MNSTAQPHPREASRGLLHPHSLERRALLGLGSAAGLLGALGLAGCSSTPSTTRPSSASAVPVNPLRLPESSRDRMMAVVMLALNTPYKYGGSSPEEGFDCSGLVFYALGQVGHQGLPRSSVQWATRSIVIAQHRLQRGDFVFFNTTGPRYSHMGIYVSDGEFVHAPSSGKVVSKANLNSGYFQRNFIEARTVFA